MVCITDVHYKDADGNDRNKIDNRFGTETSLSNIAEWILLWLKGTYAFDIQILESSTNRWLDFDDDYINQQNPYAKQSAVYLRVAPCSDGRFRNSTPVQNYQVSLLVSTNTTHLLDGQFRTSVPVQNYQAPPLVSTNNIHFVDGRSQNSASVAQNYQAPWPVLINYTNPVVKFALDVNTEQRDQDLKLKSKIKGASEDYFEVPQVKIDYEDMDAASPSTIHMLVFLVWEVCENGTRILYYHPYRKLVNGSTNEDHVTIVPTADMFRQGDALIVSTQGIHGARTGDRNKEKHLFCRLENRLHQETTYETSRLACLLMVNGKFLWNTLALSKAMIFTKPGYRVEERNVLDCGGQIVEKVIVQIFKYKKNLNQRDTAPQYPAPVKKRKAAEERADNDLHINSRILPDERGSCSVKGASIQGLPVTRVSPVNPQSSSDQYPTGDDISQAREPMSPNSVIEYPYKINSWHKSNASTAVPSVNRADSQYITLASGQISPILTGINTNQSDMINNRTVSQMAPSDGLSDAALIIYEDQFINDQSCHEKQLNADAPDHFAELLSWM